MRNRAKCIFLIMLAGSLLMGCGAAGIVVPPSGKGAGKGSTAKESISADSAAAVSKEDTNSIPEESAREDSLDGEEVWSTEVPEQIDSAEEESMTAETAKESMEAAVPENPYAEILDYYYYGIQDKWEHYEDEEDPKTGVGSVSFLFSSPYSVVRSLLDAGYMLTDIDQDGSDELIVSPMSVASIGLIYDLYTIRNGLVYHIAYSGERYAYTLCQDNKLVFNGSGGAAYYYNVKYRLEKGSLYVEEEVNMDAVLDEENPWFYGSCEELSQNTLKNYQTDKLTPITEEEADTIVAEWNRPVELQLTAFADYTPQSKTSVYSLLKAEEDKQDYTAITQTELEEAEEQDAKIAKRFETEDLNQMEMNQLTAERYKIWDDELNMIWKRLKEVLDSDTMAELTREEREWIKAKEEKVTIAGAEFEGGSMQPMIEADKGMEITKARVYELVERYLK